LKIRMGGELGSPRALRAPSIRGDYGIGGRVFYSLPMVAQRGRKIAGKYQLTEPLGEGGMATVWKGLTLGAAGFSRRVAIKRVLPELAHDTKFAAMFVEEARVVSELAHPNIVQVHDFDHDDEGNYFIVMEYVDGLDLEQWIDAHRRDGKRAPWHYTAAIGIEVLRALTAAHERLDSLGRPSPVIHRDVTPTNILLGKNGIVKLADFGLARATDRASMTKPGTVKGKLAYMAPEVLSGRSASEKSDIFCLGMVLWEALVGHRLYDGKTDVEVIMKAREAHVPSLAKERPDLPPALAEVIHAALVKNPDERFESAREMQRALASILKAQPEPTDSEPLARSVRKALEIRGG
jgi:serine/threonine protein kinase